MPEGRFLNKRMARFEGIYANTDSAIVRDSDNAWNLVGGIRVGDNLGIATFLGVLASLNFAAIQPVGSTGAQGLDVALAGVTPGDLCWAAPVQSLPVGVVWSAACYSAGAVNVRITHTQSGNIDLAEHNWRIVALRFK